MTEPVFPPIEELQVYGVDVPVPTSFDELRARYNEKEPIPPLKLEELEGYCVPPPSINVVAVNGVGIIAQKGISGGWRYPAGTFREDKSSIGKELGKTADELIGLREKARKENVVNAMADLFEEKGLATFDVIKDKDPQLIAAAMSWAFEKIDKSDNPKEALNFVKYMWDKLGSKDILRGREDKSMDLAVRSVETIDAALTAITKMIEEKKGEVIEAELYDVTGDES